MVLDCDISSYHYNHFCAKLFSNPTMHNQVMGWSQTGFTEVYAQSLSADCDLDLRPSDMVLVCNTSSYQDDHLCQIILNFSLCITKLWVRREQVSLVYAQNLSADCELDFDLAACSYL